MWVRPPPNRPPGGEASAAGAREYTILDHLSAGSELILAVPAVAGRNARKAFPDYRDWETEKRKRYPIPAHCALQIQAIHAKAGISTYTAPPAYGAMDSTMPVYSTNFTPSAPRFQPSFAPPLTLSYTPSFNPHHQATSNMTSHTGASSAPLPNSDTKTPTHTPSKEAGFKSRARMCFAVFTALITLITGGRVRDNTRSSAGVFTTPDQCARNSVGECDRCIESAKSV